MSTQSAHGSGLGSVCRWGVILVMVLSNSACSTFGADKSGQAVKHSDAIRGALPDAWQTVAKMDAATVGPWQVGQPSDGLTKGSWWTWFNDATLNQLQQQAAENSPTLAIARARWRQAKASVDLVDAASFPQVGLGFRSTRSRSSVTSSVQNDVVLQGTVGYEWDLWGRQHDEQNAAKATQAQIKADLLNARLVLSAELAAVYFNLRSVDAEMAVLDQGLQAQTRAASVLAARHEGGIASSLDVAQQQAQIDATRTQVSLLQKQRDQLLHALATLTGMAANQFQLTEGQLPDQLPSVPVGLPSEVLQRRPDVASAERAVAAANSRVGLAGKAWFPSIQLSATGGWQGKDLDRLINTPSLIWAVGASLTQAVFDGGKLRAREQIALAEHDITVQQYRQTVLRAIQEVEDGLSALKALDLAQRQSQSAIASAQQVQTIAQERYSGGVATYLDVVTAQQNVLNNQRLSSQIRSQQLQALTYLIKALGGGWQQLDLSSSTSEH